MPRTSTPTVMEARLQGEFSKMETARSWSTMRHEIVS